MNLKKPSKQALEEYVQCDGTWRCFHCDSDDISIDVIDFAGPLVTQVRCHACGIQWLEYWKMSRVSYCCGSEIETENEKENKNES